MFRRKLKRKLLPYFFLLPAFISLIVVNIYPLIWGFIISLHHYARTYQGGFVYVGLRNYIEILNDSIFYKSLLNTVFFSVVSVGSQFLLGLVLALCLNESFKGRSFFRSIIVIPWVIPTVVATYLFRWLFHPFLGIVNDILYTKLHIIDSPILWLASKEFALPTAILVNLWKGFPFYTIMLLAALQSISESLYEAAMIDGANRLQRFRFITLPSISLTSMILIILGLVWNFNGVTLIYTLTGGGPGHATLITPVYAYNSAFGSLKLGYGSAISWFVFPFTLTLILIYVRVMLRRD